MSRWSQYMFLLKRKIRLVLTALVLTSGLCAALSSSSVMLAAEPLSKLIDRANAAASQQDYPEAIGLYEQAVQKNPSDKTLKSNLAILYANYGVTLQEQRDYNGARQNFDKALSLSSPQSQEVQNIENSKSGTFYAEAMDLRNQTLSSADPSSGANYARMKELLEQAMVLNPNEQAYRKGMATVYLDEAYALAGKERYAEAAPLLEQAMTFDSQSEAIRTSLANVYLGLARNDSVHRQEWINKALSVDNSPRVKQTVDQILAPPLMLPAPARASGVKKSFATPPGELKPQAPRDLGRLSVLEMIRDMENQLSLTPAPKATLQERLEQVETHVMGSVQTGPMTNRAKAAYSTLMGSSSMVANAAGDINFVQAPAPASETSYLDQIFKVTDGKVVRWGKFPLRVYIEEPKDNPLFKPEYKEAVLNGFEVWKVKTNGFTSFLEVKNQDAADIQVTWAEQYTDRFADPEKTPDVYRNYTPPKRTRMLQVLQVASMLTPGYFSLAPQALGAAVQYQQYKKLAVLKDESILKLGLTPTKDLSPDAARILVQNMAAKEFGHALGLKGNSATPGDLLYPELKTDAVQVPSPRDVETLRELYDRPPNIVLNFH